MRARPSLLQRVWKRLVLTGVLSRDAHRRMELMYRLRDPWRAEAPREQLRFIETDRFITEHVGPRVATILELACGEGHHSEHLARIGPQLTGIDVSRTAIQRARRRVPAATFVHGEVFEQPWARERGRFDLVTACEVLYLVRDKTRLLRAMDRLGHHCVVTYYAPAEHLCEREVMAMPGAIQTRVQREGMTWVLVHWKGEAARGE
jgi:2-polyprenyl-3-methyl-5-hydroxy-6-metoxy-1,4-benzoquinol methylase